MRNPQTEEFLRLLELPYLLDCKTAPPIPLGMDMIPFHLFTSCTSLHSQPVGLLCHSWTHHIGLFLKTRKGPSLSFCLANSLLTLELMRMMIRCLLGTDSQEYMASLPKVLQTEGTAMIPSHLFASCTSLDSHPVGLLCQSWTHYIGLVWKLEMDPVCPSCLASSWLRLELMSMIIRFSLEHI